jgi:hypothetical protein
MSKQNEAPNSSSTTTSLISHDIADKLTSEQLLYFLEHIEKRDKIDRFGNLMRSLMYCFILMFFLGFFVFFIFVSSLSSWEMTQTIMIGILAFLGGFGSGFGLKK